MIMFAHSTVRSWLVRGTRMTFSRAATAAAIAFGTVLTLQGFVVQGPPPAPQTPPPVALPRRANAAQRREPGRGGGRGRGNAAATLFTEICAGCHGTDRGPAAARRASSTMNGQGGDDEGMARPIANGVPRLK